MVSRNRSPQISLGITSLVVMLTVLSLTIFSVMTLSTALNERHLSQKSAAAMKRYYEAETYCAEIANEIGKIWDNKGSVADYMAFAEENNLDCQLEENEIYFSYQYPIDESQALFAAICIGEDFEIQQWRVQATQDWQADESLQIWDGESME